MHSETEVPHGEGRERANDEPIVAAVLAVLAALLIVTLP